MAFPFALAFVFLAGGPSEVPVAEGWVVEGRISGTPHAHPIQPSKGQHIVYVDTVSEGQVVAYLAVDSPPRGSWVRLAGTALRFETTSPRPGSTKKFPVKQLTVENVERLTACDALQALLGKERTPALDAAIEKAGKDAFPVLIAALDDSAWNTWWLQHRGEPFEAIRDEQKRLTDEFFKSGAPSRKP